MYVQAPTETRGQLFPESGATVGFEPPIVGAGNQTLGLCKNSKQS